MKHAVLVADELNNAYVDDRTNAAMRRHNGSQFGSEVPEPNKLGPETIDTLFARTADVELRKLERPTQLRPRNRSYSGAWGQHWVGWLKSELVFLTCHLGNQIPDYL
jgi:hypothetical protein